MKITTKILLALLLIIISGVLLSNIALKKEYDKIDKSDNYWTYEKVLEQPFKHLNITGGNTTNIAFEQSTKPSVRILTEWRKYHNGTIKAHVSNDTLYLGFDFQPVNLYEKFWMKNITAVRLFSPGLLSVEGFNTNFEMTKMRQKNINVNISGKSTFELESMLPELDSLNISQQDSSSVVFEMSPDYKKPGKDLNEPAGKIEFHNASGTYMEYTSAKPNDFNESFSVRFITAVVKDHSILDVGHAQVQNLQMAISDSAAIILSGNGIKKVK